MPAEEKTNSMMASLGMEDMNIPELKLVQATGGDYAKEIGAQPGQFFVSTTNEILESVTIQIVNVGKTRSYWGRSEITEDPPKCSSLDGTVSVEGIVCKTDCPYNAYRERANMDKEERRKECLMGFEILALDEQIMPLKIRLMGISADAGRDLSFQIYRMIKLLHISPGGFFFKVTSFKKKSAAGEAWAIKFIQLKDKFPSSEALKVYEDIQNDMGISTIGLPIIPSIETAPEKIAISSGDVGKVDDVIGLQIKDAKTTDQAFNALESANKKAEKPIDDIKF